MKRLEIEAAISEKTSLLAIAYYNLGSQEEFLDLYPDCLKRYKNAIALINC